MIKFEKPQNLNGAELLAELASAGIKVTGLPLLDENGNLWLDIDSKDESKAKSIVTSHNGSIISIETIDQKLSSVGLSIDDLKVALGL